jgi:3',5'-cyclic AMP phosphodiesterase CpdA
MNTRPVEQAVRLVHFSDIHITAAKLDWKPFDWLSKRATGWLNLRYLGREHRFRSADQVLAAFIKDIRKRRLDHVIFSGDATALGFEAEIARATEFLGLVNAGSEPDPSGPSDVLPGMAVPGNHDYYTPAVAASGLFERYFAPWQLGKRIGEVVYPFAQRVGNIWLVGVNSCTGNRWTWDAAGSVGRDQLDRLTVLLRELDNRPRILVTHYPVCLATGKPEPLHHRLRDAADLVAVAASGNICLWLHGHRHHAYHLFHSKYAPFPVVCAGSTTQTDHWSYNEYVLAGQEFHAVRRAYSPGSGTFEDIEVFDLQLPS